WRAGSAAESGQARLAGLRAPRRDHAHSPAPDTTTATPTAKSAASATGSNHSSSSRPEFQDANVHGNPAHWRKRLSDPPSRGRLAHTHSAESTSAQHR